MSRIYDALKKLESERGSGPSAKSGGGNGHGNGSGNGNGNGNGHGKGRRVWQWLFGNGHAKPNGGPVLNLNLGPEIDEAYQQLGTNLLVSTVGGPHAPKLLGVTASRHGEGTTTTAAVFGSILARRRTGRVGVVEANFRSPSFDRVFGTHPAGGLAELIRAERTLADVLQPTPIPNLFAIGAGKTDGTPSALFDSPGLAQVLEQLRSALDFVIFDLPPVNLYGDASIVGPRLDAALIVIEADRTRIPEVERTRRALDRVGVRLVGSVLNRRRSYIPAFLEELL